MKRDKGVITSALHPDALVKANRSQRGARSNWGRALLGLYKLRPFRKLLMRMCFRLEGGPMFSQTWREILLRHHGVLVGKYSYGPVLTPGLLPRGTQIGTYCSIGAGLIVRRRDHPVERPILHPFLYNASLGMVSHDTIPLDQDNPLVVGHDVWMGDRVTILGGCKKIGNGAVIGAGAVVTRDVAPYSIVGGVPARLLRMRFGEDRISFIEASRWWEKDIAELIENPPFDDIWEAGIHSKISP